MARLTVCAIFCVYFCIFNANSQSAGKQVQFYDQFDFQELIWQGPPLKSSECTVLPLGSQVRASSIKTNTCIMLYPSITCSDSYPTFSLPAGQYSNLFLVSHFGNAQTANERIRAFRECREDEGNTAPHIELWNRPVAQREILVEYYNVTECITLPAFARSAFTGIYNHGNCFDFFASDNCTGDDFVTIHGGTSRESEDLSVVGFDGQTKSIIPCLLK